MEEFEQILRLHRGRYPGMELQDYGKLAFQSEFGPGHFVRDRETALRYLEQEWQTLPLSGLAVEPEPIGNGLCRVHLSACTQEQLPRLAERFCRAAQEHRGTREGLARRLNCLRELGLPGMEAWLRDYEAAGCPMVRHSQRFRALYAPHYRVLRLEDAAEL